MKKTKATERPRGLPVSIWSSPLCQSRSSTTEHTVSEAGVFSFWTSAPSAYPWNSNFRDLRQETVRKGVLTPLRAWIRPVCRGPLQARPSLFGQFELLQARHVFGESSDAHRDRYGTTQRDFILGYTLVLDPVAHTFGDLDSVFYTNAHQHNERLAP
jgi:hypothetical protein